MIARTLALAVVALTTTTAAAQPPAGADLVPSNAAAFATLKVADIWDSDQLKPVRDAFAKHDWKVYQQIEKVVGVAPAEIERVTVFWPVSVDDGAPYLVVTTRKPFNEAKVLKALRAMPVSAMLGRALDRELAVPKAQISPPKEAAPPIPDKKEPDKKDPDPCGPGDDKPAADATPGDDLFFLPNHRPFEGLCLVDDRTLLFLPLEERGGAGAALVITHLLKKKANGPLTSALNESAKHTFVAAAKVPSFEAFGGLPAELVPFRALTKAKVVAMTADLGATAKLTATLSFPDAAAARRAEPVLKTLMILGEEQLAAARKEVATEEFAAVFLPLIDMATKSLNQAATKADGAAIVATAEAELGPAVAKAVAAAPQLLADSADRMRTQNNLRQIGLAIHNYHDSHNQMPLDILDAAGKPILSWRVQILPYLEQDNLFRQIDMTKPWDDPANKRFLETMPDVFRVHGRDIKVKGMTYLQMPSADKPSKGEPPFGDPFKIPGVRRNLATITDGTSNTFMVVEAEDPVLWMKPDDVKYDPKNLPKLGSPDRGTFLALFGDGSVRAFQRKKLTDAALRGLLTVNGGEVVDFDR